jgi:putative hydrolase of the HAD superfamily
VITDLHLDATKRAFHELKLAIYDESVPHNPHHELFIPLEIGKISPEEFRNKIRDSSASPISDDSIDNAWNALLGELPPERWHILEKASKYYNTYLLSNTNAIHQPYYYGRIQEWYGKYGFEHLFIKSYFSHILGMRKPNADIFQYVIDDAGLLPQETMFIDDFIENIETARHLGFQTIHLQAPLTLVDVFK